MIVFDGSPVPHLCVLIEDWMLGFSTSVMSNAFVHLKEEDGKGQDEIGVQNDDIG